MCSFSIHFQLVSAHCVIQLLLSYAFFHFIKEKTFVSKRLRQSRKIKTKSNVNKIMSTYLLCMKKGVS